MTNVAKNAAPAFVIDAIVAGAIVVDTIQYDREATPMVLQSKNDLVSRHPFHQLLQAVESRAWNSGMLLFVLVRWSALQTLA